MAYCTAVKFCGNKDCSDLPFPWYCSVPWRSTWQPSGTRALGHPSSRCNLCLQCFHYGNQGKALIKICTHRVGCSAWSVLAVLHLLWLLCILCWLRSNLLLITNRGFPAQCGRATSDFRVKMVGLWWLLKEESEQQHLPLQLCCLQTLHPWELRMKSSCQKDNCSTGSPPKLLCGKNVHLSYIEKPHCGLFLW